MGILKRNVSAQSSRTAVTIVARGNRMQGDLHLTGKLHVDGELEGRIESADDLAVGRQGVVRGTVRARQVTVSGVLEGELHCESLHIERGGRVSANVCSEELIIEPRASFVGERRTPAQAQLVHLEPEPEQKDSDCLEGLDYHLIDSLPDRITLAREGND